MSFETIRYDHEKHQVIMLDQIKLPHEVHYHHFDEPQAVADAITNMIVRGAPAIGVTAGFGLALAAQKLTALSLEDARAKLAPYFDRFEETRPTAVNLFWAIKRIREISDRPYQSAQAWADAILRDAQGICDEDISACRTMGKHGASLLKDDCTIMTHCNAGALATAGWGTALGVIRSARELGKRVRVFANETRPYLQGARLTTWELMEDGIDVTLITDNTAASMMASGEIDAVITGADRIASNGDVANKIGTFGLAIMADYHRIPFYVAAPLSTIDLECMTGTQIPIEERSEEEVVTLYGQSIAPKNCKARHLAFDVTPSHLVSAIVTENGIAKAPYESTLKAFFK